MTPLHIAAERGRYRTVEYLVGKGAHISAEDNDRVGAICDSILHFTYDSIATGGHFFLN